MEPSQHCQYCPRDTCIYPISTDGWCLLGFGPMNCPHLQSKTEQLQQGKAWEGRLLCWRGTWKQTQHFCQISGGVWSKDQFKDHWNGHFLSPTQVTQQVPNQKQLTWNRSWISWGHIIIGQVLTSKGSLQTKGSWLLTRHSTSDSQGPSAHNLRSKAKSLEPELSKLHNFTERLTKLVRS